MAEAAEGGTCLASVPRVVAIQGTAAEAETCDVLPWLPLCNVGLGIVRGCGLPETDGSCQSTKR